MKKERGSITIITLTTVLFMLAFLVSTYTIITNRRQVQAEMKKQTKKIYEAEIDNMDKIYQGYFAKTDDIIPIYTVEQLLEIGTGKDVLINNYIYNLGTTNNYKLMSNIEIEVETYSSKYPTLFTEVNGTKKWIGIEEQLPNGTFEFNEKAIKQIDSQGNEIENSNENESEEIWDMEWEYQQGLAEDNGFGKLISGDGQSSITNDGMLVSSNSGYIRYTPELENNSKTEIEIVFKISEFSTSTNGLRIILSNGTYGAQVIINNGKLHMDESQNSEAFNLREITSLTQNTEYKLKISFDENTGNIVYLDDEIIYESTTFSYGWASANRIFQQTGGTTLLKSIKYNFYE